MWVPVCEPTKAFKPGPNVKVTSACAEAGKAHSTARAIHPDGFMAVVPFGPSGVTVRASGNGSPAGAVGPGGSGGGASGNGSRAVASGPGGSGELASGRNPSPSSVPPPGHRTQAVNGWSVTGLFLGIRPGVGRIELGADRPRAWTAQQREIESVDRP